MGHIPRNEIWQSHFKQGHSFTLMQLLGLEPFWGFRWQFPDRSQWLLLLSMPKYPDLLFWHSNSNWDETSSFSPWLPYLSVVFGFVGALLVAQTVKNLPAMQETQVQSLEKDPTPVFLPREFHGQRSLVAIVHRVAKSRTWLSKCFSSVSYIF